MIILLLLQEWCRENFVNSRNMGLVKAVQAQLREICLKVKNKTHVFAHLTNVCHIQYVLQFFIYIYLSDKKKCI